MKLQITEIFKTFYKRTPTYTITANGRANIIGEHTDYHFGYVFPFAINKGICFCGGKSDKLSIFSTNFNAYYSASDKKSNGSWQSYISNCISTIEEKFGIKISIDLVFGGDLPIGAGLSSSSALCCGLIELIVLLYDLPMSVIEKINLASQIEHGTGVAGGKMDQYTIMNSIHGKALLLDCRNLTHQEVSIPLNWSFFLINSGVKHNLVHTEYNARRKDGEQALALLQQRLPKLSSLRDLSLIELENYAYLLTPNQYKRTCHVLKENERVMKFKNSMQTSNWQTCGSLLNESHQSLRDLYEVSCEELDTLQLLALENPSIAGSRMMGGGFGGCVIILAKNEDVMFLNDLLNKFKSKYGYLPEAYTIRPASGLIINE